MLIRILITSALILFSCGIVSAQKARNISVKPLGEIPAGTVLKLEGIIIEPNKQFIEEAVFYNKIDKAMQLLKSKSPDEFKLLRSVIGKIRATKTSGANYNEAIMTIDLAKETFESTLEWLASVLVHEAQHIKKYKDTGKKYGDAHLMTDKKAALKVMIDEELECNRIQIIALENVGGQKYEIDYLKAQKGDHFDIDKDGDYDWDDYNARDW